VRRILLNRAYDPWISSQPTDLNARLAKDVLEGNLDAQRLLAGYCFCLYQRLGTYEAVAQHVRLDRRTVKKHIESGKETFESGLSGHMP
jgi:hypothetical protein